jgi:hypothetical protein
LLLSKHLSTVAADYVKVLLDDDYQLCTFAFFKKHVKPKQTHDGVLLDSLNHEMFLEVKVPYESAFALSPYMEATRKNMQETKADGYAYARFGPGKLS